MIVLATIDRYALTSSRSTFRTFASISTARRAIITSFLFWSAAGFHLLIGLRIENNRYLLYGFLFSVFQLFTFGIVPSVLMIIFASLLIKNIRRSRTRSESRYTKSFLRKRDRSLIELVYTKILLNFICTFPYSISSINMGLTNEIRNKSTRRIQVESLRFFFFITFLQYLMGYLTAFYGYLVMSKSFRREIHSELWKLIGTGSATIQSEPGEERNSLVVISR